MKLERKPNRVDGNALIVTLVTIAAVAGFIALSIDLTRGVGRNVQRSTLMRQAINIGDATTEMAFSSWRAICIANSASPAPALKFFDSVDDPNTPDVVLPTPSPGNFPGVKNYALKTFSVVPLAMTDASGNPLPSPSPIASKNATPSKIMGPNPQNYSYYYLASADVIVPTMTQNLTNNNWKTDDTNRGNVVAHVRRVFEKRRQNKTDKAIDYKDDLEIHPGPTFVVNGTVHTNGNLYTGHDTLTLNGTTTFTGAWSIGFKPGDDQHNNNTPSSPNWASGRPPSQDQAEVPYGVDAADYHKLIEPSLSTSDSLYPFSFSTPSSLAQSGCGYTVAVTIDAANNVKIYNSSGTDITNKSGNSNPDAQMAALMKSAITTNTTITDNRQGGTTGNSSVRLATLDVGVIAAGLKSSTYNKVDFSNPVIYIADTSAVLTDPSKPYNATTNPYTAATQRGIRLKNGATLPDVGLTVASSNPVYIQGDYNTGRTAGNEPGSNTTPDQTNAPSANPASPEVSGYDRKPAAVISDAVTVLSNAWSEVAPPNAAASNTTVSTAIITGIVPSGNGYYSGGAENFPRFLENWNTKTLTYYGSMIQLFNSEQGNGYWGAANVYSPPNRAWYFDNNFLSTPPAGVPYDVDYRRSRWYMD
jgi:hypothetical protein